MLNNPVENQKAISAIEQGVLARLARLVIAHRRAVLVFWLIVFLAGGFSASQVSKRLSYNFAIPGQPAYVTSQAILRHFGNGGQTAPRSWWSPSRARSASARRILRPRSPLLSPTSDVCCPICGWWGSG